MTDSGIYLIVEFDWPRPVPPEVARKARLLHDIVQADDWVREVVAASGGVGSGRSSVWIFWLENYAALDTLLRDYDDPAAKAYMEFFGEMTAVEEKIREEVQFQ